MPSMPAVQIQPPERQFDPASYARRLSEQIDRGFRDARETMNQMAALERLEFVIPGAVADGTYVVGILPSNRTVQALWHGLRAGTCTATLSHGPVGSLVDIEWDGLSPADDVPVTTTIAQELPANPPENVALGTWVQVVVSSASGANGLALTLHLT